MTFLAIYLYGCLASALFLAIYILRDLLKRREVSLEGGLTKTMFLVIALSWIGFIIECKVLYDIYSGIRLYKKVMQNFTDPATITRAESRKPI